MKKGGFQHLINTFSGLEITAIESKLTLRCIESLIGTILEFVTSNPELRQFIVESKEKVVLTCLRYIHLIGLFTL
jgi:hypothetical protein